MQGDFHNAVCGEKNQLLHVRTHRPHLSIGLSDVSVSITSLVESGIETLQEWKAHDFELWTTCYDIHQPQLVYTGSMTANSVVGICGIVHPRWYSRIPRSIRWEFVALPGDPLTQIPYLQVAMMSA